MSLPWKSGGSGLKEWGAWVMGETCKGQTRKLTKGSQPGWALWKHSNGTDAFSLTKVWGQLQIQFSGPIGDWQKHFPGEKVQVLRFSRVPDIRGDLITAVSLDAVRVAFCLQFSDLSL